MHQLLAIMCVFVALSFVSIARAQAPIFAGNTPVAKPEGGFTPGWTFGTRLEGSSSADGTVLDLGTGIGYNFSHHFGIDAGVPYYFVGTPSSIKKKNPNAVSGNGVGSFFTDAKLNFSGEAANYDSTVQLTLPTGDTKKGFSTGHATWNWSNHFEHGWGSFTPFWMQESATPSPIPSFFIAPSLPSAITRNLKLAQSSTPARSA